MHRNSIGSLVAAIAWTVVSAHAATPSCSISREYLLQADISDRLTVGTDVTLMDRGIEVGGLPASLESAIYNAYVGYDVLPWLTVFTTLGGLQIKENDVYGSSGSKWSLGVAPNIWEGDLRDPSFLAGKISLTALGETTGYNTDQADWQEYTAALLLRYEIFEDPPWSAENVTSLRFSAGPAISAVSGDWSDGGAAESFRETDTLGWMAAVELFPAPAFAICCGAESFDGISVSGSLRLHF